MNGKYSPKPQPVLTYNNQQTSDPATVAIIFASHYANISTIKEEHKRQKHAISKQKQETLQEYNSPITMRELQTVLENSKDKKGT